MQIAGVELEDLEYDSIGSWPKGLRIALIIAASLITLGLGYMFDLSDMINEYDRVKNQRDELQVAFEKTYDQASNLEEYKKQVISVEKSLESLTRQLPKSAEEAGLLEDLSRQAISSGLAFQSFKPLPEVQQGFYVEHPIEILLQGNYHSFGEFASNVAAMSRIATLHNFSIKSIPGNPKRLDITVTVQTYWSTNQTTNSNKEKDAKNPLKPEPSTNPMSPQSMNSVNPESNSQSMNSVRPESNSQSTNSVNPQLNSELMNPVNQLTSGSQEQSL